MRHLCNIGYFCFPGNIFSNCKTDLGLCRLKFRRFDQVTESNHNIFFVRNFNSYRCFSRNRRLDTDIRSCQIEFDIVGQSDNLAHLHTHFRLNFISCHCRSAADVGNGDIDPEVL